jgi:hypothetical protein
MQAVFRNFMDLYTSIYLSIIHHWPPLQEIGNMQILKPLFINFMLDKSLEKQWMLRVAVRFIFDISIQAQTPKNQPWANSENNAAYFASNANLRSNYGVTMILYSFALLDNALTDNWRWLGLL